MKRPILPQAPTEPVKPITPNKYLPSFQENELVLHKYKATLADILNRIGNDIDPKNVRFEVNSWLSDYNECDAEVVVYWPNPNGTAKNPYYDIQLVQYEKALVKYAAAMVKYKEAIDVYNRKHAKYIRDLKVWSIQSLEKKLKRMKTDESEL